MDRQLVTPLVKAQFGVVTRAQLVELGVGVAAVDSALRRGELRPLHRGIYALGATPLRDEGVWLAAVLACGPHAILSHLSAARLWEMRTPRGDDTVHVTLAAGRRAPPGITTHRTRRITRADVTVHRGVPVTTPARTVVDVADITTYDELRALADHGVRLDPEAVRRAQHRAPGRRGAPDIARLLRSDVRTRSTLERALRRLVLSAQLPKPRFNEMALGKERDAVWRTQRLVVEVDGAAFHAPKPAREADYERTAALVAAGWRVLHFTYDQVVYEPDLVGSRIAAALAQGP